MKLADHEARAFRLTDVPPDFIDDPYPYYAALRTHDPVHELAPGSFFLTRHEDVVAVYRDPRASSDKKREFRPKLGDGQIGRASCRERVYSNV